VYDNVSTFTFFLFLRLKTTVLNSHPIVAAVASNRGIGIDGSCAFTFRIQVSVQFTEVPGTS
jgi:hypothetical protein